MFELVKYKNRYWIYCTKTKNFLVYGTKKNLTKKIEDLNKLETEKPTQIKTDIDAE